MGQIHSHINVYSWRKPTLEITLLEGGSLLANTTYYVLGAFICNTQTYMGAAGPPSDVYEITTTSTHKSFSILAKTYLNIQSFEDNGGGTTIVNCTKHCLNAGDIIKIDSGLYQGTHTITQWLNYNQFVISTAFSGTEEVECYNDSAYYNKPNINVNFHDRIGYIYYVSVNYPIVDDNITNNSRWTMGYSSAAALFQNPFIVLSQPNSRNGFASTNTFLNKNNRGLFKILQDEGSIIVQVNNATTLQEIYEEVQASGNIYSCYYNPIGGYNSRQNFFLNGALCGFTNNVSLNVESCVIEMLGDLYAPVDKFYFKNCSLTWPSSGFTRNLIITADNCVIYDIQPNVAYSGYIRGNNPVLFSVLKGASGESDYTESILNLANEQTSTIKVMDNKRLLNNLSNNYFENGNSTGANIYIFKNIYFFYPVVWNMENINVNYDSYMFENVVFNNNTTYDYHIRFNQPVTGLGTTNQFKFLNVDTEDVNNVKKIANNLVINLILNFYRRIKFNVQYDGTFQENVKINITDNLNNNYEAFTDINGFVYIDILEQNTKLTESDGTSTSHRPQFDTLYNNFVISFTKDGLYSETLHINNFKGNENLNISLLQSTPIITGITITDCTDAGSNDGSIEVTSSNYYDIEYSIDGVNYQQSNVFSNLSEGVYTVYVKDENGAIDSLSGVKITKPAEILPQIAGVTIENASAIGESDGSITITAMAYNAPVEYSIGGAFQSSNVFTGLAAGTYAVTVRDSRGNIDSVTGIVVNETPYENLPYISAVEITNVTEKDAGNGSILITGAGVNPPFAYSLDNINFQYNNKFTNLVPGSYSLYIKDVRDNVSGIQGILITEPVLKMVYRTTAPIKGGEVSMRIISGGKVNTYHRNSND